MTEGYFVDGHPLAVGFAGMEDSPLRFFETVSNRGIQNTAVHYNVREHCETNRPNPSTRFDCVSQIYMVILNPWLWFRVVQLGQACWLRSIAMSFENEVLENGCKVFERDCDHLREYILVTMSGTASGALLCDFEMRRIGGGLLPCCDKLKFDLCFLRFCLCLLVLFITRKFPDRLTFV